MGSSVLVVDDDPNMRMLVERMLREAPYRVHMAGSGEEALERLAAGEMDVLVADYRMPGMSGIELLTTVRAKYPEVVRILLTGHATLEAAVAAINEGAVFSLLQKPCGREQLLEVLGEAVRHRASAAAGARLLEAALQASDRMAAVRPATTRRTTDPALEFVSRRELEVLRLLAEGHRIPQVAEQLFVSPHTVRNHVKSMFKKLGLHSQAQLVSWYHRTS